MAEPGLKSSCSAGRLTLTLDRPALRNALDDATVEAITHAVADAANDDSIRVIVFAATGRHFSAGVDLARMAQLNEMPHDVSVADGRTIGDMLATVHNSPKPTIAAVQGGVFGGALALVAACDIVVASELARFGAGEARLGLIPVFLTPYLAAAIGPRAARHYLLTCERIGAQEAYRLGLAHRVTAPEALMAEVDAVIAQLVLSGPGSIAATKRILSEATVLPVSVEQIQAGAEAIAHARATAEAREGIAAFLGKRPPAWANSSFATTEQT